jgi:hypothetical protein
MAHVAGPADPMTWSTGGGAHQPRVTSRPLGHRVTGRTGSHQRRSTTRTPRDGRRGKFSDHAPIIATFDHQRRGRCSSDGNSVPLRTVVLESKFSFNQLMSQQSQTLAYALLDSPVGLHAWNAQLLCEDLDPDFALTNVCATGSPAPRRPPRARRPPAEPTTTPTAVAAFARSVWWAPGDSTPNLRTGSGRKPLRSRRSSSSTDLALRRWCGPEVSRRLASRSPCDQGHTGARWP